MTLLCSFCGKECKNSNSFRNHERTCPSNINRVYVNGMTGKKGSNGYTKAKRMGLPPPIVSIEDRIRRSEMIKSRTSEFNKLNGEKISRTIQKKVDAGTWHTSLCKKMHYNYKGIDLHGNWEYIYAQYLDANSITWERCKENFPYKFEGRIRKYTPDFYLLDSNEYIEIKGYETEKDFAKWSQFPLEKTLIVLKKNELQNLGLIL